MCPSSYSNGVGSTCVAGICQPTSCNSGYVFNALTGSCQNVLSDLSNWYVEFRLKKLFFSNGRVRSGSLGNVCSFANGVGSCTNGVCTLNSCSTGFYKVNGVCTYLNLQSDGNNW